MIKLRSIIWDEWGFRVVNVLVSSFIQKQLNLWVLWKFVLVYLYEYQIYVKYMCIASCKTLLSNESKYSRFILILKIHVSFVMTIKYVIVVINVSNIKHLLPQNHECKKNIIFIYLCGRYELLLSNGRHYDHMIDLKIRYQFKCVVTSVE